MLQRDAAGKGVRAWAAAIVAAVLLLAPASMSLVYAAADPSEAFLNAVRDGDFETIFRLHYRYQDRLKQIDAESGGAAVADVKKASYRRDAEAAAFSEPGAQKTLKPAEAYPNFSELRELLRHPHERTVLGGSDGEWAWGNDAHGVAVANHTVRLQLTYRSRENSPMVGGRALRRVVLYVGTARDSGLYLGAIRISKSDVGWDGGAAAAAEGGVPSGAGLSEEGAAIAARLLKAVGAVGEAAGVDAVVGVGSAGVSQVVLKFVGYLEQTVPAEARRFIVAASEDEWRRTLEEIKKGPWQRPSGDDVIGLVLETWVECVLAPELRKLEGSSWLRGVMAETYVWACREVLVMFAMREGVGAALVSQTYVTGTFMYETGKSYVAYLRQQAENADRKREGVENAVNLFLLRRREYLEAATEDAAAAMLVKLRWTLKTFGAELGIDAARAEAYLVTLQAKRRQHQQALEIAKRVMGGSKTAAPVEPEAPIIRPGGNGVPVNKL